MIPQQTIDSAISELFDNLEVPAEPSGLYDPFGYMVAIGGKRLRPRLCLTVYGLFRDSLDASILMPASGLEIFHTFTLIHDDIMDRSPLRRGKETVWKKWKEDTAILSGDVMCIDSYRRMAMAPSGVLPQVLSLFTATAAQVCEGQQYDMDFEQEREVPMADYMKMIGLKTGVLIACSAKTGALIGGASERDCDKIYDYGYNLGLAFQVEDDWLDAYGDEKGFGKPIGGDIVNNKKSWLTIRAFEKASPLQREKLLEAMEMPVDTEGARAAKISAVRDIYDELGVGADARAEIVRLTDLALSSAAVVCSGEKLEILRSFAQKLVGRNK